MNTTTVLSVLAAASALLFLRANQWGPKRQTYIFKPLATFLILLVAVLAPAPEDGLYKWAIVLGLALSMLGDILLLLPKDKFVFGLIAFLIAHICFIVAFASGGFFKTLYVFLPFVVYGVVMLGILKPYLGKVFVPAIFYTLALMVMGWQAANRWLDTGSTSSLLAFAGALLFILSDSILIINRFRSTYRHARLIYMSLYYLALWLIAVSVVVY